jgi:hypothetical protein
LRNVSGSIIPHMNPIKDLQIIPGVGKSIARDLVDLGIKEAADLRNRSPEKLYEDLCFLRGRHIDRCVLYVFRCAVYFASANKHDPYFLKWWHWKDIKKRVTN